MFRASNFVACAHWEERMQPAALGKQQVHQLMHRWPSCPQSKLLIVGSASLSKVHSSASLTVPFRRTKRCISLRATKKLLENFSTVEMGKADLSKQGKLELVLDIQGELLEGPIWDERVNKLHFIDINGQNIHTHDPHAESEHRRHSEVKTPEPVGNIGLTEDPNILLVALKRAVVLFDITKHSIVSKIAESPEEHGVEEYRFNDGKISPGGVFIGGRMHKTSATAEGKHGRWYKLEWRKEAGKSRLVQLLGPDGVQLPNGLDWNSKKGVMYFNDSINNDRKPPCGVIWEYKTDDLGIPIDTSPNSQYAREVKTLGVNLEGGVPDGMCLDHEGRIWTALCGGGAVVCIDPESGDELHRIKLPVSTPTACAFAGRDQSVLYITTIDDKSKVRGAGGLWSYHLPGLSAWSAAFIAKPLD